MSLHDLVEKGWANTVTLACIVVVAIVETWQEAASSVPTNIHIPRLDGWFHYVPLGLLSIAGMVWLIGRRQGHPQGAVKHIGSVQPSGTLMPGIPTLSGLLGQNPTISFDSKAYFAKAYYSPITAEIEKNIKIAAQQSAPNDKEGFYARFIGVGVVSYQHEVTWFTIFKSQLLLLKELNSGGIAVPLKAAKKHYDKAVLEYAKTYTKYSFDQWMNYMQTRMLIVKYPSDMVELTHGGKDFLKFAAHRGWDANVKAS